MKQFLSTLIQFGTEISQETGDKVQELVINLVVSSPLFYHYFKTAKQSSPHAMLIRLVMSWLYITLWSVSAKFCFPSAHTCYASSFHIFSLKSICFFPNAECNIYSYEYECKIELLQFIYCGVEIKRCFDKIYELRKAMKTWQVQAEMST